MDPAIARGGDQYLVAWTDARTSFFTGGTDGGSGRDVYAVRLDADGNLIDTTPIVVTQDESDQYDPVLSWNGQNWLVLWTGTVPYGPAYRPIIEGARISPDGEVLDAEPIAVRDQGTTRGTSGDHLFGVASDGTDWALVVADEYSDGFSTNMRLEGRRVTADGDVVNAPYYLFSPSCCYFFYEGGLAYVDGVYMAVFEGYVSISEYGLFGLRMAPGLTTLDTYPLLLVQIAMQSETHYYRTPSIAAGNGMFYVGWQLYISGTSSQIYGARVDASGQSLDGDGVPISDPGPLSLDLSPDLTWDGTQWIAGWNVGGLSMARIDAGGTVLDPGGVDLGIPSGAFAPTGAGGLQLVRSKAAGSGPTPYDVFQSPVSSVLNLGPDQCISLGAPAQIQPELASGTDGYLLVYRSDTSDASRIMARPLDAQGDAVDPEPVLLASGTVDRPRTAFDGSNYLVLWSDGGAGEIHARRLSQDGTVLDPADIVVLEGFAPDAVGWDGQFFVTASQAGGVHGARVSGDGTVLDDPSLLVGAGGNVGPRVEKVGAYYVTVWEATGGTDGSEIVLSLTNSDGFVAGPMDVTLPGDGLAHHRPVIVDGQSTLIVWEDDRAGNEDLYGRRMSYPVTYLDPPTGFAIVDATSNQHDVAVAWDGTQFLTCFTDDRDAVNELDQRTDIYRNWVTPAGLVDEPTGVGLLTESVPEIDPAVASGQGNALYAAARFTDGIPYAAYRIWLRYAGVGTGVNEGGSDVPAATNHLSIYPNPFNPSTTIRFDLERPAQVSADIFDLSGRWVCSLLDGGFQEPGPHLIRWNGRDDGGKPLASGVYLLRLRTGDTEQTRKLAILR